MQARLTTFPDRPPVTLGDVMIYRRALTIHLDALPGTGPRAPGERQLVTADLANYCRTLQIQQRAGVNTTVMSTGLSGQSRCCHVRAGAKIVLLAVGFGIAMLTALKTYDVQRRQSIIDRLIKGIDDVSWNLKQ